MLSVRVEIVVLMLTTLCFRSFVLMLSRRSSLSPAGGDSMATSSSESSSLPPLIVGRGAVAVISVRTAVLCLRMVSVAA
jgi:hypothetical protein